MKKTAIHAVTLFLLHSSCFGAEQHYSPEVQKIIALTKQIELHTTMLQTMNDSPHAGHYFEPCVKDNVISLAETLKSNLDEQNSLIKQLSDSDLEILEQLASAKNH